MPPTDDGGRTAFHPRWGAGLAALALAGFALAGGGPAAEPGSTTPSAPVASPGLEAGEGSPDVSAGTAPPPLGGSPTPDAWAVARDAAPGMTPQAASPSGRTATIADPEAPGDVPAGDGRGSSPGNHEIAGTSPEGFTVLAGTATAGHGERRAFTIELEEGFESYAASVVATVGNALLDTESSWARDHELVQVAEPDHADIRIVVASPATVDEWCGAVGLDTGGDSSCWDGSRAMLNGDRWRLGVEHIDDLETYRAYLVNHEVGHGLGHGHVPCPEPGAAAPVMMQQTLGLGGCEPNPWPYP